MYINFILLFISYFTILLSIIGYGFFLISTDNKSYSRINIGFIGLYGLFFITIYSYFSHLFLAHSKIHNIIFLSIGIIFFVYFFFFKLKNEFLKKDLNLLFFIFFIIFISILISKNHDDFPYYHFAYTLNLTQEPAHFGIGKFNHGFRTPSSIFYINSIFYLPYVNYYLFNFAQIFILGFANIILLKKTIFSQQFKDTAQKEIKISNIISLISLIFINIFFYRISEHGTDRSAQILIFILFILLIELFQNRLFIKSNLNNIFILFSLIISFKAFYFMYSIFLVLIIFFIFEKRSFLKTLKIFFLNKYFFYLSAITVLVLLTNFLNSGCILYPLSFTCIESLDWSISVNQVSKMSNWYELWSKSGANPNYREQNPEIYIQGFNWVQNWLENYFFNKVSDFILGISFLLFIIYVSFIKFKKKDNFEKLNKFSKLLYFFLVLVFVEWFNNHPALRYGGYCVIALLIFIPFATHLIKLNFSTNQFKKIGFFLIIISIIVFEARNLKRINNEIDLYGYKPLKESFYKIDDNYFKLQKIIQNKKNFKGILGKSVF